MMKKWMIIGLCATILAATSFAFAEDVYVTKQGKKYHQATCTLIKNRETQKISLTEAKEQGLEPCSKCFKGESAKTQTGSSGSEAAASSAVKSAKKKAK